MLHIFEGGVGGGGGGSPMGRILGQGLEALILGQGKKETLVRDGVSKGEMNIPLNSPCKQAMIEEMRRS